jgi:hypothetical protein
MVRAHRRMVVRPGMKAHGSWLLLGLVLLGIVSASGCGTSSGDTAQTSASPSPSAVLVASGQLSGRRSQTVDLGVHELGASVWVAWTLAGREDSRSEFRFTTLGLEGAATRTAGMGPVSFGLSHIVNERAMFLSGEPGKYHVSLRQIVEPRKASGYAVKFQVFTSP